MRFFVAVTDDSWFRHLAALQPDEVNFWQPSGGSTFQAVPPGSPFLFKLHSPNDYIAGGGFFLKFELLLARSPEICRDLLQEAAYDTQDRFGPMYLARARLGQGAFRVLVTSAYERRCAVTGEKVLPTLEAAHIRPHADDGPNKVSNGLLLRSDFHRLFDRGYITLTPELHVEVCKAIREEFDNGDEYYVFNGRELVKLPAATVDRPAREYLEWHNENVFRAS